MRTCARGHRGGAGGGPGGARRRAGRRRPPARRDRARHAARAHRRQRPALQRRRGDRDARCRAARYRRDRLLLSAWTLAPARTARGPARRAGAGHRWPAPGLRASLWSRRSRRGKRARAMRACARTPPRPGSTSSRLCAARTEGDARAAVHSQPAFRDPVRRIAIGLPPRHGRDGLARAGSCAAPSGSRRPAPLNGPAAALLLTLCDYRDAGVAGSRRSSRPRTSATFLRFHTGASLVASPPMRPSRSSPTPRAMPPLSAFAQGTPDYPDRSTTLICRSRRSPPDGGSSKVRASAAPLACAAAPLPADFVDRLRANRAAFPCGVDIFLARTRRIAALPRSVRVTEAA